MTLAEKSAAFAAAVAKAMNDAKVPKPPEDVFCALMTVVGDTKDHTTPPLGFSINCNDDGMWEILPDMMHSMPVSAEGLN